MANFEQQQIELLQQIAKSNEAILSGNAEMLEKLRFIADKAAVAEMRQCQANAQGTDAARMTAKYFQATSALWSSSAQEATLEMIYKGGSFKSLEYGSIFTEKDKRRAEMAVALYYKTYIEGHKYVYDIFEDHGEPPEDLFCLMPTFRELMIQLAKAKDNELGPYVTASLPHGSYVDRVCKALPEIPEPVKRLNALVLPLNKQFEAAQPCAGDFSFLELARKAELYEHIPEKAKEFVESCIGHNLVSRKHNKAAATTECIVKWCWHVKQTADMAYELDQEDYKKKRRTMDEAEHEAERKKRAKIEKAFLEDHSKRHFPALDEVHARYAELLAKREAPGEPGPEGSTQKDA